MMEEGIAPPGNIQLTIISVGLAITLTVDNMLTYCRNNAQPVPTASSPPQSRLCIKAALPARQHRC